MARSANYSRSVYLAGKVLLEAGISSFPVSLKRILRHFGIRLRTYDRFVLGSDYSDEECYAMFGPDGATIAEERGFLIVYNDVQPSRERIYFTLAHELGHIFLGHHQELGTDRIRRFWVEKPLYEVLEDEANCFARNLLCPPSACLSLLQEFGFMDAGFDADELRSVWRRSPDAPVLSEPAVRDYMLIHRTFHVSELAAKTRCHFLTADLSAPVPDRKEDTDPFLFSISWHCLSCGRPLRGKSHFCSSCGGQHIVVHPWKDSPLPPPRPQPDEAPPDACPACGCSALPGEACFCPACGIQLFNCCVPASEAPVSLRAGLVTGIVHLCPPDARFCDVCGAPTLFSLKSSAAGDRSSFGSFFSVQIANRHMLDSVRSAVDLAADKEAKADEERGYVSLYRPDLTVSCPRCGVPSRIRDRRDCRVCACDLLNWCSNRLCRFENPPNARFCIRCGSPTVFSRESVFDPATRKKMRKDSLAILRKYRNRGVYYQYDDPPEED